MAKSSRLWTLMVLALALATLLVAIAVVKPAKATFPDRAGSIAFTSDWKGATKENVIFYNVYRMPGDGHGPKKKLTDIQGNNTSPAWSPDGATIAFVYSDISGVPDLYRMDADGSNERPLTNDLRFDVDPSWYPSGRKIVFSRSENVCAMSLDASGAPTGVPTRLTKGTDVERQPVVSPDGKWLAFASDRDGDFDLYVMKAAPESATNVPVKLTNNTVSDTLPDWSPNGKRLAFARGRDGSREVYVIKAAPQNRETNHPMNLTGNRSDDSDPAWSPDGKRIAFTSDRTGDEEIWRVRSDGTGAINLTNSPHSDETQPAWQPLP